MQTFSLSFRFRKRNAAIRMRIVSNRRRERGRRRQQTGLVGQPPTVGPCVPLSLSTTDWQTNSKNYFYLAFWYFTWTTTNPTHPLQHTLDSSGLNNGSVKKITFPHSWDLSHVGDFWFPQIKNSGEKGRLDWWEGFPTLLRWLECRSVVGSL